MGSLVYSFFITDSIELIFQLNEYKGRKYCDLRQFVHTERYTGPTKQGLSLKAEQLRELVSALEVESTDIEMSKNEKKIRVIDSRPGSKIIISLVESTLDNNPVCLDIREYVEADGYTGFTRKGIRIPVVMLKDLIEGCKMLINSAE